MAAPVALLLRAPESPQALSLLIQLGDRLAAAHASGAAHAAAAAGGAAEAAAAAAALRAQPRNAAVQVAGCRVLHLLAARSDADAMAVLVADGVALCAAALRTHASTSPEVAREACLALRDTMGFDARRCGAAGAAGADVAAFLAMDAHPLRFDVQLAALSLLAALLNADAASAERATTPRDLPARLESVLRALSRHAPACQRLTSRGCAALAALGACDAAGPLALARGAFSTLVAAAQAHAASPDVQHTALCALGQLCSGRAQEEAAIAAGAVQLSVAAVRAHARCSEPDVLSKACYLLHKLSETPAGHSAVCDPLLLAGGGAVLVAEALRAAQAPGALLPPYYDGSGPRSFWLAQLLCRLAWHAPALLAARVPDMPRLLLGTLREVNDHAGLADDACTAAGRLALLSAPPGLSTADVAAGVDVALLTMRTHRHQLFALQRACWALHALCACSSPSGGACPAAVARAAAGGAAALVVRVDAALRAAGRRQEPGCAEELTALLHMFSVAGAADGGAGVAAAAPALRRMPASFQPLRRTCAACNGVPPTGKLKRCGSCRGARYCSAACQHAHWPAHKAACRLAAAAGTAGGGGSGGAAAAAATSDDE
jgi:hypothetical protein